eukprot:2544241-Rhodomonas_salina.1
MRVSCLKLEESGRFQIVPYVLRPKTSTSPDGSRPPQRPFCVAVDSELALHCRNTSFRVAHITAEI